MSELEKATLDKAMQRLDRGARKVLRERREGAAGNGRTRRAPPAGDAPQGFAPGKHGRVHIEGDGDLAQVCDQIEAVLIKAEAPIYRRGGMLVRVIEDRAELRGLKRDPEAPRIVPFDDVALADLVTRLVEIHKRNRKTGDLVPVDCPRLVAQTLLSRKEWNFAPLEAVIEHPVMLPDGQVLWESQHHASGLLLRIRPHVFQSPPASPDRWDAEKALEELCELLEGFDFVDRMDLSVALAFLMTPFVRPVIPTAPAFAIDAHAAGSGKTTLVRLQARISAGREPSFIAFQDDRAELRKMLLAVLLEGDPNIAIDNVADSINDPVLAMVLTAEVIKDRLLGQSAMAAVPTKAVISFNGNNLQIVGDLTRRVLVCRLDPQCDRPAERTFEFDPIRQADELRSELVNALLTIMSAYVACQDRVSVRPFGSFSEWSRLVREPLVWLGMPDPVDSLRVLEAADPERLQLQAMLRAVHDAFGMNEFKAGALIAACKGGRQASLDGGPALSDVQRDDLAEALQAVCERKGELNNVALGRWLLKVQGRVHEGLRFVQSRQTKTGTQWRVQRA